MVDKVNNCLCQNQIQRDKKICETNTQTKRKCKHSGLGRRVLSLFFLYLSLAFIRAPSLSALSFALSYTHTQRHRLSYCSLLIHFGVVVIFDCQCTIQSRPQEVSRHPKTIYPCSLLLADSGRKQSASVVRLKLSFWFGSFFCSLQTNPQT